MTLQVGAFSISIFIEKPTLRWLRCYLCLYPHRSIATLAITTLLKTGAESSVDRLMKQISSFVSEISDEFKIVVVQAISALCTKFPKKHGILLNFLSGMLRDEGGLDYKVGSEK